MNYFDITFIIIKKEKIQFWIYEIRRRKNKKKLRRKTRSYFQC